MSARVQDFALIIGHVWRCNHCREALFEKPETMWLGYKLSEATGLSTKDLETAIEHPRARLRHLGSVKGDYYNRLNGNN